MGESLKKIFFFLCIVPFLFPISLSAEGKEEEILLLRNGRSLKGKVQKSNEGFFVSDDKRGVRVSEVDQDAVVSLEYWDRIRNSSPLEAAFCSILLFHAGQNYEWNSKPGNEDVWVRAIKIGLVFLTSYFFWEANQANRAIGNSFLGIDDGAAKERFRFYNNAYGISGAATLAFFGYTAVKAYVRFGKDSQGNDLRIQERGLPQSPAEFDRGGSSVRSIELGFTMNL